MFVLLVILQVISDHPPAIIQTQCGLPRSPSVPRPGMTGGHGTRPAVKPSGSINLYIHTYLPAILNEGPLLSRTTQQLTRIGHIERVNMIEIRCSGSPREVRMF